MKIDELFNDLTSYNEIIFSKKIDINNRIMYLIYESEILIIKNNLITNATLKPIGILVFEEDSNYIKFFKEKYKVKNKEIMDKFKKEKN